MSLKKSHGKLQPLLLVDVVCGRGKVLRLFLADSTFILKTFNELDVKSEESHFTCWADT